MDSLAALVSVSSILLAYMQAERLDKDRRVQEALEAIQEAIAETRKYIERENPEERDRSRELELSKLWGIASTRLKKINPDLAGKLRFKSSYWENSIRLSRREIHQNGIALRQIERDFQALRSG